MRKVALVFATLFLLGTTALGFLGANRGLLIVGGTWWESAGATEVYDWGTRRFVAAPAYGPVADPLFSGRAVALPDGDALILFGEKPTEEGWTGSDQVWRFSPPIHH